jgi:AhpD family alkylhydroperoxidase
MSESPVVLNGYLALEAVLARGTFTAAERQLVLVAASATNGCAYCAAAHSTFAASLHASDDALAAARGSGHADDPRTDALITFTHAVARDRGHVGPEVLERFLAAGFTTAQAMEVAANVGLKTISNYIDGFAHVPLDGALVPQRWAAPLSSEFAAAS